MPTARLHVAVGVCNWLMSHVLLEMHASQMAMMRCGITACEQKPVSCKALYAIEISNDSWWYACRVRMHSCPRERSAPYNSRSKP